MKPVLADTSHYVAFLSPVDQYHGIAADWSERLLGKIVVTEYVLIELGSMLAGIQVRHLFVPFVDELLRDASVEYIPSSSALLRQGMDLYAARPDKEWSLVDCISFVVMKQRRLTDALTADHHFEQAGFRALLRHAPGK